MNFGRYVFGWNFRSCMLGAHYDDCGICLYLGPFRLFRVSQMAIDSAGTT